MNRSRRALTPGQDLRCSPLASDRVNQITVMRPSFVRTARTVLGFGVLLLALEAGAAWEPLEPGLDLGVFAPPQAVAVDEPEIRVLRVDPARFALRLLNASAPGNEALTPREWCKRHGLVAATNASMYQTDMRSSVGLMKTRGHVNNPRLTRDKAVLAFDRRDPGVPPVQIIDRQFQDFTLLSQRYDSFVQSIRMVSLVGRNVWTPQPHAWSTAAIAIDRDGRVLFIHTRAAYRTHDLGNILLALPLGLRNAMYAEGGPEAQLYVRSGSRELELAGRFDTGFLSGTPGALPVPNVIGVVRRRESGDSR